MNSNRIIKMKPSCVNISKKYMDIHRMDSQYYDASVMELVTQIEGKFKMDRAEELFDVITDGDHGVRNYIESGVPFYTAVHVQEEGFERNTVLFIDREYEKSLKRSRIEPGSLLVVKTGVGTGKSCVSSETVQEGNISADVGIFKNPRSDVSPYFVSAFMNSPSGRKYILRSSYGSTRNRLTINELKGLKLPLLSQKIQIYIGNKIRRAEKLREESSVLRKEAESIFKREFSFKPRDLKEKNWIVESGILEERLDTSYYDQQYLELKKYFNILPKGRVKRLRDIAKKIYGGYPFSSNDFELEGIPLLRIRNIKHELMDLDVEAFISETKIKDLNHYLSDSNTVLVGMDGNFLSGSFAENMPETFINQRIGIIKAENQVLAAYLSYFINSDFGQIQLARESVITTVGHISLSNIEKLRVCLPEDSILNQIGFNLYEVKNKIFASKQLIDEAKQDIEDLIEGKFDHSKITETV